LKGNNESTLIGAFFVSFIFCTFGKTICMFEIEYKYKDKKFSTFLSAESFELAEKKINSLPSFITDKFSDIKVSGEVVNVVSFSEQEDAPEVYWQLFRNTK
jgi:hypothetical protein